MPLAMLGTLFALTLVLFLLIRRPRRELRSGPVSLLRCVFPAWRFFEEIADAPTLSHRVIDASGAPGPWLQTLQKPRRYAGMWGLNAAGNLHLAYQSLIEQLASELAETTDPTRSVSYQLVQALVVEQLRAGAGSAASSSTRGHYQWRLTDSDPHSLLWVSPVCVL